MAITEEPVQSNEKPLSRVEKKRLKLPKKKKEVKKPPTVLLRIPPPILKRIDKAVHSRTIHTPRHTWLMEALLEKLAKENF